ncbi:hypothetical protein MASR2M79_15460 [Aminivibrio sp.]
MIDAEEYKECTGCLTDTPEEGADLRLRSELMNEVSSFIEDRPGLRAKPQPLPE